MKFTKILLLTILATLFCSCSGTKLKKNNRAKSITEINCNKISKIKTKQTLDKQVEELLIDEYHLAYHNKTLILNLAKNGYSRITFKDEIISDVFFYPEDALQVSIHNSGYIIVMPISDSKQSQLTLTTRNGITQDLMLKFTKDKPNPITLIKGGEYAK